MRGSKSNCSLVFLESREGYAIPTLRCRLVERENERERERKRKLERVHERKRVRARE